MKNSIGLLFASVGFAAVGIHYQSFTLAAFAGLCFGLGYVRAWKDTE